MSLKIYNTSILTAFGSFEYAQINAEQAKRIISSYSYCFTSAIGHEATAQALTTLLNIEVPVNRIQDKMEQGDQAIVLKLNGRLPEGQILTLHELGKIGFTLGLITRID